MFTFADEHFSHPLQSPGIIDFIYQEGDTPSPNQTKEVVVPIPPITLPANTTLQTVNITGKNAGSVIVILNSADQRFSR